MATHEHEWSLPTVEQAYSFPNGRNRLEYLLVEARYREEAGLPHMRSWSASHSGGGGGSGASDEHAGYPTKARRHWEALPDEVRSAAVAAYSLSGVEAALVLLRAHERREKGEQMS